MKYLVFFIFLMIWISIPFIIEDKKIKKDD